MVFNMVFIPTKSNKHCWYKADHITTNLILIIKYHPANR
nr:MAG TPA: hypothetical protein [Caudoviricetes sp.]